MHKSGGASVNVPGRQRLRASSGKGAAQKSQANVQASARACMKRALPAPIAEAAGHVSYGRAKKQAGAKKEVC